MNNNRNIIIHHIDDDGRCAAFLISMQDGVEDPTFIPWDFRKDIELPKGISKETGTCYIVDCALNPILFDKYVELIEAGWKIVHIDHHESGVNYLETIKDTPEYQELVSTGRIVQFFHSMEGDDAASGCLLSYIYTCMDDADKQDPSNAEWGLMDSHNAFIYNGSRYQIPEVVKYIDDNDIFRNHFENTGYFFLGFEQKAKFKYPASPLWKELMYGVDADHILRELIANGKVLQEYVTAGNKRVMFNSYIVDLHDIFPDSYPIGTSCCVVNHAFGNSKLFGDKFEQNQCCLKYGWNGETWRFTVYSNEASTVNCAELAQLLDPCGGGHAHAAGGAMGKTNPFVM